jgi:hypothetical protein
MTVFKAKAEIQMFSKDVIHWVSGVKSAFENLYGGRFTATTQENLKCMRWVSFPHSSYKPYNENIY